MICTINTTTAAHQGEEESGKVLSDEMMQRIASELNQSVSAFVTL